MPTVLGKVPKPGRKPKSEMKVLGEVLGKPIEDDFLDRATVVGCRPEDRAMLGTAAGKELVKAATSAMVAVPNSWPFPPSADPLDALTAGGAARGLQLALWVIRHQYPEGLKITPEDIAKMTACTEHLQVQPQARVWRRPLIPATPGRPPSGNKPGVAPTAEIPPAPFVTIQLVDEKGDAFRLMENNEEDNQKRIERERRDQIKAGLPGLITAVRTSLGADSDILNELCNAATLLARAS